MNRTGLAFLTVFGLVWWLAGVSALGESFLPVAALAGGAVAAGVWRTGRAVHKPGGGMPPREVRRRFAWINVWLRLAIASVNAAAVAGVPELVPALVAAVVGLHFLPLAVLFAQPRFHLTGADELGDEAMEQVAVQRACAQRGECRRLLCQWGWAAMPGPAADGASAVCRSCFLPVGTRTDQNTSYGVYGRVDRRRTPVTVVTSIRLGKPAW